MEENKTPAVEEKTTETTEKVEKTDETKAQPEKEERTLTQSQVNEIVKERLAKAKKGYPSDEELKQFNDWKESQKTESEKQAEKEKENQKILNERDDLKRENLLLRKGVKDDDIDYVLFKVSKQEGEFKDNLDKYLADNPKYLKTYKEEPKTIDLGGKHTQEKPNDDEFVKKIMGLK